MTSSPASTTAATASPPEPEYKTLFESLGLHSNSDSVFLNAGAPGPDSLLRCSEIMQKATEHRLASGKDSYVMQYGPELGEIRYLDQLVPFLTGQYGSPVERNSLIGTAGASNGLHMTLSILYNQENPVVFVEELTYYLALGMLRPFTDKDVVAVPFRSDGIDLVAFEKLLLEHRPADWQTRQHPWALFYAIPTYHNPTGRCYSDDVLQDLVQLARKYGMLVVCDDVYNVLRYTPAKTAYGRFFGFDKKAFDGGWRPFPNAILLGDSGFPDNQWLITPLRRPRDGTAQFSDAEIRFNRNHKKTLRVVECSFGVMKQRFGCLGKLRIKTENAAELIKCVCVLHNLALNYEPVAAENAFGPVVEAEDVNLEPEALDANGADMEDNHARRNQIIDR